MHDVERLLTPGEQMVARTGLHAVVLGGAASFAVFVGLVVFLLIRNNELATATDLQIAAVGVLIAACGFVTPFLRLRRTAFLVTDRRLVVTAGGLRRQTLEIPLERANVREGDQTLLGRWLGYGSLGVSAPADVPRTWAHVVRPGAIVAAVNGDARRSAGARRGAG